MQYLPDKPHRFYGPFAPRPGERARPIPDIQWDTQVIANFDLHKLKQVRLLNWKTLEEMEDPDETLASVQLVFGAINYDYVDMVDEEGNILEFDSRPRYDYRTYQSVQGLNILLQYEEVEDFIGEIKALLD